MQRNAIKEVNIERHRRRNNIFVVSQFWSLASGTKELLSRSRRIYCIPSRAISSHGVFGQRLAWGDGRNTAAGLRIRL